MHLHNLRPSTHFSSTHTSLLQARIASKRTELQNLTQLRDLSANLASQLAALEAKLGTLKDGAASVALVLANWENVLRAIGLAAMKVPRPSDTGTDEENGETGTKEKIETTQELPVPLVRIPVLSKTEDAG